MFKNEEGFSLLELVVAVGVAGIIAAVALPTFAGLQTKAETTSATYAASASAAEALANSTMGTTGSTGSASSSSNQVSIQPITVTAADFATVTPGNEWADSWAFSFRANAYATPALLPTVVAGDVIDWTTSYGSVQETIAYVSLNGVTAEKSASIATAIDNGATTVIVDGVSYGIVTILNPIWNGSQHIATNVKYSQNNHNYSNGKNLVIYISGLSAGQMVSPTSVTVQ